MAVLWDARIGPTARDDRRDIFPVVGLLRQHAVLDPAFRVAVCSRRIVGQRPLRKIGIVLQQAPSFGAYGLSHIRMTELIAGMPAVTLQVEPSASTRGEGGPFCS